MPNHLPTENSPTHDTSTHHLYELNTAEKRLRWQALAEQFKETTDRLGMEIDTGITETVIALNALGFPTHASCEGHIDHGIAAPWVDITANENTDQFEDEAEDKSLEADTLYQKFQEDPNSGIAYEQIEALWTQAHELHQKARRPYLQTRKRLITILNEFYTGRDVPSDVRLTIESIGHASRLQSLGADIQEIEPENTMKSNLSVYQTEMHTFTAFLKKKYFEE